MKLFILATLIFSSFASFASRIEDFSDLKLIKGEAVTLKNNVVEDRLVAEGPGTGKPFQLSCYARTDSSTYNKGMVIAKKGDQVLIENVILKTDRTSPLTDYGQCNPRAEVDIYFRVNGEDQIERKAHFICHTSGPNWGSISNAKKRIFEYATKYFELN